MAHPQIAVFARLAEGDGAPSRVIAGQATRLSRTMHAIQYDALHDEIVVSNPFAKAILTFRGGANGEEPPIRIIQGPSTQLGRNTDRLTVDPVNNEIIVPIRNAVLVFPREAEGDVAPIRVLKGPDTQLGASAVAVDPVRDLLVVSRSQEQFRDGPGALLIFNRTDQGNVKPRAVIRGPKAGLGWTTNIQVYPPRGWIVVVDAGPTYDVETISSYIGVWSINDNGDVPPRWKIGGPNSTIIKPRGVVLNPKHKEIIVSDKRLNAAMTYYFPEIF